MPEGLDNEGARTAKVFASDGSKYRSPCASAITQGKHAVRGMRSAGQGRFNFRERNEKEIREACDRWSDVSEYIL
jgi:xanthine/CO dehydrogenase XdhC/CoxF family maturation factor